MDQPPRLHPHGTPPRFSPPAPAAGVPGAGPARQFCSSRSTQAGATPRGREAARTPCASQQGDSWLDMRQSDPIAPQEVTRNFYERLNDNTSP